MGYFKVHCFGLLGASRLATNLWLHSNLSLATPVKTAPGLRHASKAGWLRHTGNRIKLPCIGPIANTRQV